MNEIFEWVLGLNMLKGNELLLPSTVEWFLINNDSAILHWSCWVFTILARSKPHEWPIAEWSTKAECCFWLRQFAWCSLNLNAWCSQCSFCFTNKTLRTVITRNSIDSSSSISVNNTLKSFKEFNQLFVQSFDCLR